MTPKPTRAERIRSYRARAKTKGLCSVCRCRPARASLMTCQACNDRTKAAKARIKGVLCVGCCVPLTGDRAGMTRCTACTDKAVARRHKLEQVRIAAGCCARCGGQLVTRTLCQRCAEAGRVRMAGIRAAIGVPSRRCSICGQTGHNRRVHDRLGV